MRSQGALRVSDEAAQRAQFVATNFLDGVLTVRLIGPTIGQREAPIVAESILTEIDRLGRSLRVVILDLSDVSMLASMGLGAIIDIRHSAARVKAVTILFGMSAEIEELVRMIRLERLCRIARTIKDLRAI